MIIFVDGEERYRAIGDFATVNKPLTINAHGGTTKVKSVHVITPAAPGAPAAAPGAPASPTAARVPPPA
jgi:hypothetical protein